MHRSDHERARAARRRLARFGAVSLAVLTACEGSGSDIGPRLPPLPAASSKVVVLDDAGRGVVAARVVVGGATAVTGRNGRGDLFASPRGRLVVDVDGRNAAAVAGDVLGQLRFAATIAGPDLPAVVHLPAFAAASSVPDPLPLGSLGAATVLTAPNGGVLTVPAGCSVGSDDAAATTVLLRVGDLAAQHVPGDLPAAASGALSTGRVFCVDPPGVTFTPAADLDLPDDLGLGGGAAATLFGLDAVTGEWATVATGLVAAAGRVSVPAAVARGGVYVLGVEVPAATLSGRVVLPDGNVVPDVMVVADAARTVTDGGGRFTVAVPGQLADGTARAAALELFAGGSWLPARLATTVAVAAGAAIDVGDLVLDTTPGGNIRVQLVRRGRATSLRTARISAVEDPVALSGLADENGQTTFEDVPDRWFGFQDGLPLDQIEVAYGQGLAFLAAGRRWLDLYHFLEERPWHLGSRRTRTFACDAIGGGPIEGAALIAGSIGGGTFLGLNHEVDTFFVDRPFNGRATATLRSERGSEVLVHAFSIEQPNGDHLELPLQRLWRAPLGAFDRHGIVTGTLLGAVSGPEYRLRSTRRLELREWWDELVEGAPSPSSLPIDFLDDPDTTAVDFRFRAGVAAPAGNLVAAEVDANGGSPRLERLGIAAALAPVEGGRLAQDLPLDLVADTPSTMEGALAGLDAAIDPAQLDLDLGVLDPAGNVIDVVRGLRGNHTVNGADLGFELPSLDTALPGHRWLALLRGTFASGADTLQLAALYELPANGPQRPLPAFPTIVSPAAGAAVPASGFTVGFTLPPGALYGTLELRSATANETLLWQVVVPPDVTEFAFVALPAEAATPLLAGRTYTLTVSAYFGDSVLGPSADPFRDRAPFWLSIGRAEDGARQVARRSLSITAN